MDYTPKINPAAVLAGYVGADPKVVATLNGYLQSQQKPIPEPKTN